jgi:hypothetical protein
VITMSNEITIYGYSDDLIEIEGAIREEYYTDYNAITILEISPGYQIAVEYTTNGMWRIDVEKSPGDENYEHHDVDEDGPCDYSETVKINHPGEEYEVTKR